MKLEFSAKELDCKANMQLIATFINEKSKNILITIRDSEKELIYLDIGIKPLCFLEWRLNESLTITVEEVFNPNDPRE